MKINKIIGVKMDQIQLMKPYFDSDELKEVENVLNSGWVSKGPKVEEFEKLVANYIGCKYSIAVTNCTAALHLSLLSLGIGAGDEVIVADYTFPATGHSVLYCGATPVFADIDQKTYNIDTECIDALITDKTKAIIPVHTFGQPADMDEISEIAQENKLFVIEDAACALGATYKGKFAGIIGDIGCFSFHARKGITTGEGGMVVTNDEKLATKIRQFSTFGMVSAYERENMNEISIQKFENLGYNYKMSDITAAIGVAQMKKLDAIIKEKNLLAKYYNKRLENINGIDAPYVNVDATHVYQSYIAIVSKEYNRNKLINLLLENGIQTQIGTYASHIQPVYKSSLDCPNSLNIYKQAIALPMYYGLKKEQIDYICDQLKCILGDMECQ